MAKTVECAGVIWTVISRKTVEELESKYPNTARDFRKRGIVAKWHVKRANGKKHAWLFEDAKGRLSFVSYIS
jgi:hypothetical protein